MRKPLKYANPISADDSTREHEASGSHDEDDDEFNAAVDPDAKMQDPDELARALDDDEDEAQAGPSTASDTHGANETTNGVGNGNEWRQ